MVVTSYLTKLCQFALQKRATFIVKGSCDFLSDKDFPPSHCFLDTYNLQTHKGYNRYLSAFCEWLHVLVNLATPSESKPIQVNAQAIPTFYYTWNLLFDMFELCQVVIAHRPICCDPIK